MCEQIAHFFQHYKDLEKGKWVSIVRWLDAREAEQLIMDGIKRARKPAKSKKKPVDAKR
jgi:inorganic pyrophosphatase